MNYRHAFHAGNFADCMKHALLVWFVQALARKPAPFFVLDTHAGAGRYDLSAGPSQRTGEWRDGIARLLNDPPEPLAAYAGLVSQLGLYPDRLRSFDHCCGPAIVWRVVSCIPRTLRGCDDCLRAILRFRCIIATGGKRCAACCHRRSDAASC